MIVKIQLPLTTTEPEPLALIYDEKRTVVLQWAVTAPIRAIMKGRPKAYFHASNDEKSGAIEIGEEAPSQSW